MSNKSKQLVITPTPLVFTEEQVAKLLQMQDTLNTYIHPEWRKQSFDWHFAIIDECREIKEHLGWKWWKEDYQCGVTEGNIQQLKLEVIDILHFVLSISMQNHRAAYICTDWLNRDWYDGEDIEALSHKMLQNSVEHDSNELEIWASMAASLGMSAEEVMEVYTQKYVLNKFRQDNGYKAGSYCKVWQTKYDMPDGESVVLSQEDNEILSAIVFDLGISGEDTTNETTLACALEVAYNQRLNQ